MMNGKPEIPKTGRPELKNRTREFALRIVRLYSSLPKTTEAQVLLYWLEPLAATGITGPAKLADLRQEAEQLVSIFVASVKTVKKRE